MNKTEKTIREAVKEFSAHCKLSRSERTAATYLNGVKQFLKHIESDGIQDNSPTTLLKPQHFILFPSYLLANKSSKKSIGTYVAGVKYFYEWMIDNELVEAPDYAKSMRFQRTTRDAMKRRSEPLVRFPKPGEDKLMIEAARDLGYDSPITERNIAMFMFLRSSGCRNSEMVNLVVDDIDFKERSAVVTGKGSKQRRVYFDNITANALQVYWQARGWASPTDPAFARHDRIADKQKLHAHISTVTVRNVANEASMIAGIDKGKFTPHYFRHAFAIVVLRETGNLALVQDLLGHKSPASTRVYAKIYPDELRDAHHKIFDK